MSPTALSAAASLRAAVRVVIVPGFGVAAAQAHHVLALLAAVLGSEGVEVAFAVHPVAGRVPGQLNVLLDEAGVRWDQIRDLGATTFGPDDVALVVGADDVVNPALGMPVFEVERAGAVLVVTQADGAGFAGLANPVLHRVPVLRGDAREVVLQVLGALLTRV